MPIFGNKNKNGDIVCVFSAAEGIPDLATGTPINVIQEDDESRISINLRFFSKSHSPVYLSYDQIIAVGVVSEAEIIEKDKSVIGRAAVGGLLLGPLGAVVGGISGTGKKQKATNKKYLVINYHPSNDPDETKVISLEIVGASGRWDKFLEELRKKIPSLPPRSQYL